MGRFILAVRININHWAPCPGVDGLGYSLHRKFSGIPFMVKFPAKGVM